jgi:hypothetical protein
MFVTSSGICTRNAVKYLKHNRAPGENSITSELIKYGGRKLWDRIHQLIKIIWGKRTDATRMEHSHNMPNIQTR